MASHDTHDQVKHLTDEQRHAQVTRRLHDIQRRLSRLHHYIMDIETDTTLVIRALEPQDPHDV